MSKTTKLTKAALRRKAQAYFLLRQRGKEFYGDADEALDALLEAGVKPGQEIDLGGGRQATLIDNFQDRNTVFRPCGVRRFELKPSAGEES